MEVKFNGEGGIKQVWFNYIIIILLSVFYCRDNCLHLWLKKKRKAAWCQVNWQYHLLNVYFLIWKRDNQSVSSMAVRVQCDQKHSTMGRVIGMQNTEKVCSVPLFSRMSDACSVIASSYLSLYTLHSES